MQDSGLTHLMAGTTFAEHKDIARTLRRAITATPDNDLLDVQWEAVSAPTTTATTTTTTITTDAAVDEEEEVEEILGQWKAGWRSLRPEAMRLARAVEKRRLADADIAALGQIVAAPAADWSSNGRLLPPPPPPPSPPTPPGRRRRWRKSSASGWRAGGRSASPQSAWPERWKSTRFWLVISLRWVISWRLRPPIGRPSPPRPAMTYRSSNGRPLPPPPPPPATTTRRWRRRWLVPSGRLAGGPSTWQRCTWPVELRNTSWQLVTSRHWAPSLRRRRPIGRPCWPKWPRASARMPRRRWRPRARRR
ncbi:hypothetical protein BDZ88DRAFT_149632 [Geranomyces variabilis]|nr:hypothetical protein BDZ88DRAFT_149632 [Geranomyces variabilis]